MKVIIQLPQAGNPNRWADSLNKKVGNMIPMVFESLKEQQLEIALLAGGFFAFFGVLLILLWHDVDVARDRLQMGFASLALGALVAVLGLYLLIPLLVAYAVYIVLAIIRAAKQCLPPTRGRRGDFK